MGNPSKAPAAAWRHPVWSTARKSCVGTALGSGKIWFTTGRGIVTEVFYPRIDIPQIRDLGFIVADDQGFWQELKALPEPRLEMEDPLVPLPIIHHHHDRFDFTLKICADPERDVLLLDFHLEGDAALRPYLLCSARLGEDAENNCAWVGDWEGRPVLWAEQGPFGLALTCRNADGYPALERCTVGEVGASDLWQDFHQNGRMQWAYQEAGPGEVALAGRLPRQGTLALGLGTSKEAAATNAWSSLAEGFQSRAADYSAGWNAWHQRHPTHHCVSKLPAAAKALYARSTNILKVHEDRTFPGAMVASLSVPWGESSDSRGGYHLVWSRDLVESAGALLALGAATEARHVLTYLISTQQADGHWLQNQWLGGKPFWQGVQLDETGFPVLLASALREAQMLENVAVTDMITRALHFIVHEGPVTGQDRWEEDGGVNLFTLAVAIAALVEGAGFLGGKAGDCALMLADYWNARLEEWTFAHDTDLARRFQVAGHYVRIIPEDILVQDGAQKEWVLIKNRAHDPHLSAGEQVANDFLQLVRYGLRSADDPHVTASVKVMDGLLRTDTPCGPVWHRYNGDGYGEHADGSPFDGTGIGRGWPLLVGERGHYALAAGEDAVPYINAMAAMTGNSGLLPEQIWESDAIPEKGLFPGHPSGSAMPLVWAHGEFIKLCHSAAQGRPVDRPAQTWKRYQGKVPKIDYRIWRLRQRPRQLPAGQELRLLLRAPFTVHWGSNGWQAIQDTESEDWGLGHVATLPVQKLRVGDSVQFTILWRDSGDWQGEDFHIDIVGGGA
ncbi:MULTISPECIES: glycoside hydrolase family 15 protein [Acidithiobacillus]|uniref:Glycosyl hydrolase, family 15 n=2 Tax=Acidithiobacillus ferrooxidans TaxID=920 RepID=B7J5L1_ACIF2|nr:MULTISPECIES: glycoside hydrolase family 15 protein [Acidithiobacillus]MBN6747835.1 glycosyl hydrolase [Acidithiobacillus sp. PG05]MCL5957198.1 glycoside hydrolase family 15 protein [Gammaproteobacteria bacterium]ACH84099.1 Glucan 1,4-alpha-glucosidase [Acidithiobacillus ferrooxidans ATCC 53993]ACK79250.1 glycosyl hydrolase, family 15 [Acidithiobacillus ferrooxidans ATCC 23270]MBN6744818.1 glycosyl hydrolase [Acidithiobacillus sp. MC2.2]